MADVKNIITLGIGASPGKLLWFITSGLESSAAVTGIIPLTVQKRDFATTTQTRVMTTASIRGIVLTVKDR